MENMDSGKTMHSCQNFCTQIHFSFTSSSCELLEALCFAMYSYLGELLLTLRLGVVMSRLAVSSIQYVGGTSIIITIMANVCAHCQAKYYAHHTVKKLRINM